MRIQWHEKTIQNQAHTTELFIVRQHILLVREGKLDRPYILLLVCLVTVAHMPTPGHRTSILSAESTAIAQKPPDRPCLKL